MADLVASNKRSLARQAPAQEFLSFVLAEEVYGLGLGKIREILSPPPITPVPRSPRQVVGVCSVRGLLVTVLDLRRQMRLAESPVTRRSRILLVETDSTEVVGLLVDEVRQVLRLSENEIELATAALGGDVSDHVLGIGRPKDQVLILLDLSSIVSD